MGKVAWRPGCLGWVSGLAALASLSRSLQQLLQFSAPSLIPVLSNYWVLLKCPSPPLSLLDTRICFSVQLPCRHRTFLCVLLGQLPSCTCFVLPLCLQRSLSPPSLDGCFFISSFPLGEEIKACGGSCTFDQSRGWLHLLLDLRGLLAD